MNRKINWPFRSLTALQCCFHFAHIIIVIHDPFQRHTCKILKFTIFLFQCSLGIRPVCSIQPSEMELADAINKLRSNIEPGILSVPSAWRPCRHPNYCHVDTDSAKNVCRNQTIVSSVVSLVLLADQASLEILIDFKVIVWLQKLKAIFVILNQYLLQLYTAPQRAHNAIITSSLRQNDVADVVLT